MVKCRHNEKEKHEEKEVRIIPKTRPEIVRGLQKLADEFITDAEMDSKIAKSYQERGFQSSMTTAMIKAEEKRKAAKKLQDFINTIKF